MVAYFADGKPIPDKHTQEYGGVVWKFASREHKDLFVQNPQKYAPQFGGFCTWGVANGKLFDADPVNGWIVDGRLYMNFNADINATFAEDPEGLIVKANSNWAGLNK